MSTRQGLSRSALSGGTKTASGGTKGLRGEARGRRGKRTGRGSGRAPFDDPFGPVVGASADSVEGGALPGYLRGREPGDGGMHPELQRFDSAPGSDSEGLTRFDDAPSSGRRDRRGAGGGSRGRANRSLTPDNEVDARESLRSDEEWASEARAILLRQLALGPRSRHQLERKLAERDVPAATAAAVLDRFVEVQLIDDAEFARMWVRTRTAGKALSRSSLRRELAEKGIEPELAEDALLQISDDDEYEQARGVVRRKLRARIDLTDRAERDKEVRRLVGVLARKGYNPGAAFAIVKDVMAAAETDDRPETGRPD